MPEPRAGLLPGDSEGTARKTAASRLATLLLPIIEDAGYGARSKLARTLDVTPQAITQALAPRQYDTNLPLLERIADELGYEAVITVKVEADVRLKRATRTVAESGRRVADAMEGALRG